ncbi:hypothetical protein [Halomicrobium urmianum]|uniref:hypothetical protein n=1 Tax=Halomicrobium urmianum TaxID=1586233 RepID=UPI001CD98428|nr:hypothetical protein [Halomicrobium urmianum]
MAKTIRVSDGYYAWLKAHNREDETMFETLRRLTREPAPDERSGTLSSDEIDAARTASEQFGGRDVERFERARGAFEDDP